MPQTQLSPQLFTDSVAPFMKFLTEKFKDKPLCVSDVRDEFGKQYVDLVQEGGGVHGVALAGYTYVLEKMGIGFMKMAGTSAGSINTLLLNAVYTKEEAAALGVTGKYYETRSEKVLEYLANKPLTDMVDGHPAWRKLLLKMFTGTVGVSGLVKTAKHIKRRIILALIAFAVLVLCTVGMATGLGGNAMETAYKWGIIVTVGGLLVLAALLYLRVRFIKFLYKHAEHLGINPGKDFEQWIEKDILKNNGIATVADLKAKLDREEKVLQYRYDACFPTSTQVSAVDTIQGFDEVLNKIKNPKVKIDDLFDHLSDFLSGQGEGFASSPLLMEPIMQAFEQRLKAEDKGVTKELVIVSSDITHEIKVEFPGMHKMYWGDDYSISPAKYVRASMSVPFFFKPFQIDFAKEQEAVIKNEWWQYMKVQKNLETCALLVDGGMLSNFPINVFYNAKIPVPRKPTFGIKLEYEDETVPKEIKSLMGFGGKLVNTMRFFYDRDFILKHDMYQKTVRSIDTGKIHWLNFSLTDEEKIELFFRGALAATIFLAKHTMTPTEEDELIDHGKRVEYGGKTFSIYHGEKADFKIEDRLINNSVFEWQQYKKERMLDRLNKQEQKQILKDGAALEMPFIQEKAVANTPNEIKG